MVRPKRYRKAVEDLMQGADLREGRVGVRAAAQAAIANKDTSGFPQVAKDWKAGNDLFITAGLALTKAKIQ